MRPQKILAAAWLTASVGLITAPSAIPDALKIERTSRVLIHVGKAGAFGFAGHAHEVEGPVSGSIILDRSDPTRSEVTLTFDAGSLRVTGKGEPQQDVPEVQAVMASERVLDVKHFPAITFRSRRITRTGGAGPSMTVSVEGDLSLHGVTRPVVVPVHVTLQDGSVTAEGTVNLKQSDFGIHPVTAAGGAVRVKDELEISFIVRAQPTA